MVSGPGVFKEEQMSDHPDPPDPDLEATLDQDPFAEAPASPDPIVEWQPNRRRLGDRLTGAASPARRAGAMAIGALALGAFAIGALAIGTLAIGRLAVGRARVKTLHIDQLIIGRTRAGLNSLGGSAALVTVGTTFGSLGQAAADPDGFDATRQAGSVVGLHIDPADGSRALGRLEAAARNAGREAPQRLLLVHADDAVVVATGAGVGLVSRAASRIWASAVGTWVWVPTTRLARPSQK